MRKLMPLATVVLVAASFGGTLSYAEETTGGRPTDDDLGAAIVRLDAVRAKGDALGGRARTEWKLAEMGPFFALDDGGVVDDLEILAARWDDRRSEAMLEQLAHLGPNKEYEGDTTLAFAATSKLYLLRCRRQYHEWMNGIEKPEDQMKRIRQVFGEHPELLEPSRRPKEKWPLFAMLIQKAEELSGEDAVDLMIQGGVELGMTDKYPKAVLEYAKKLGREKAARDPYLLQRIVRTGSAEAVPMLRTWLEQETDETTSANVARSLSRLPGGALVLREFKNDQRPQVAKWARKLAAPE